MTNDDVFALMVLGALLALGVGAVFASVRAGHRDPIRTLVGWLSN